MLILTRRAGESIMLDDDTRITVLAINRSQVRIGIDAPKDVSIQREEIYNKGVRRKDGKFYVDE